jgi:hypothetical protein
MIRRYILKHLFLISTLLVFCLFHTIPANSSPLTILSENYNCTASSSVNGYIANSSQFYAHAIDEVYFGWNRDSAEAESLIIVNINYKISYYTQTWSTVYQTNGYANAGTDAEIIFSPINDKTITLKGQGVCYDDGNYLVSFGNLTDHEELFFTINSDFDETFKISKNKEYCLWISAGSGPAQGYSGLSLEVIVPLPPTIIFFSSIIPIIMWFGRHKTIIFRKYF